MHPIVGDSSQHKSTIESLKRGSFPENCILKECEIDMIHQLMENNPEERRSMTQIIKNVTEDLQKGTRINIFKRTLLENKIHL